MNEVRIWWNGVITVSLYHRQSQWSDLASNSGFCGEMTAIRKEFRSRKVCLMCWLNVAVNWSVLILCMRIRFWDLRLNVFLDPPCRCWSNTLKHAMTAFLYFVVLTHASLKWFFSFGNTKQLQIIVQHFHVVQTVCILTVNTSTNKCT